VDVGIVGPGAPALRSIANRLAPRAKREFGIKRNSDPAAFPIGPERRITPQRALWEVQSALPADAIFTCDFGEHTQYAIHYLRIDDPSSFAIQLGLSSMGSGIGTAPGIAVGARGRKVAAISGDGCFAMQLGAIAVAAAEHLPVLFVVLNDARLTMCELGHEDFYGKRPSYYASCMNIAQVAQGLGAAAFRIEQPDEIAALHLDELLARGPVVLDILIDREVRMPKSSRNGVLRGSDERRIFN
jgi:acetolactate synthase-1/2/3 large subunit